MLQDITPEMLEDDFVLQPGMRLAHCPTMLIAICSRS